MLAREFEILTQAAREAGEIALRYHKSSPEAWEKDDDMGPVSEADLAVNDFLVERFTRALPDFWILSEEMADDPARLQAERLIIIDPIDGTKAFLNGEDYFAISIGLVENGEPVAGVIYAPVMDDMYGAAKGLGATRNGQKIQVSDESDSPKATLSGVKILASRARYNRAAIEVEPPLKTHFRPSIALRLALVAAGQFDLTFGLRPSWDWDIAAGDAILREAGGILVDQDGNPPSYNQETPQQNGIVAGGETLVKEFLKRID